MKRIVESFTLLVAAAIAFIAHANAAPAADSPAGVTTALYRSSLDHFSGFDQPNLTRVKPWITPELYARLVKKLNQPVAKGDAPDIEGDVFLDCEDPPKSFTVGEASIHESTARVEVTLIWPDEKRRYTVLLKQVQGAWKISDVIFDKKDGKLTDLL
jgi:hypothetical protein